ncbi:cytochrome P450 [Rhizoctonia solani]|uniref:Cytochrome P450 n=1 Tax=Rhizoctonia solani TaxID=456999 RepID=A0A8H7I6K6_9AGAM|nr:cytochrome P450 [Rhizoctonia solani]
MGPNSIAFQDEVVEKYGPTLKLYSGFGEEFIFTADPSIIYHILVKDRAKFERTAGGRLLLRSIFGGGLFAQSGDEHRTHRKMPIFMDIAKQTSNGIMKDLNESKSSTKELDVFPWATAAALELVGEAGLGYSFSSFTGERNEYNIAIKSVIWILKHIPHNNIQQLLHAVRIQNEQAEEVIRTRQGLISSGEDLSSQAGRGRDIMTLLMKANEAEGSESHVSRQEMVGHMNTFVFAGHETTSTAVARILDVLAQQPEPNLLELPYLDGVVRETLRLHAPVALINRVCGEDIVLPLRYPIDTPSGKLTSIPMKKGTRVFISISAPNRYERIWGERAKEYLPERWIGSKIDEVAQSEAHLPGVYSSMMTFSAGSQACM